MGAFPAKDITLGNAGAALMLAAGAALAKAPIVAGAGEASALGAALGALAGADSGIAAIGDAEMDIIDIMSSP